ncbi:MAG: formylglycine-generating enzyme family protein [Phycisphaerales bacterium]
MTPASANRAKGQPAIGRADLLRAWHAGGERGLEDAAAALGYERRPPEAPTIETASSRPPPERVAPPPRIQTSTFAPVDFLRPDRFEDHGPPPQASGRSFKPPGRTPVPPWPELLPWPTLEPRLSRLLGRELGSGRLDVAKLVDRLARLEAIDSLPRSVVRRSSPALTVMFDGAWRLAPLWFDYEMVAVMIVRALQSASLRVEFVPPDADPLREFNALYTSWRDRDLLVLGDLGVGQGEALVQRWTEVGRRVQQAGGRALALLPCRTCRTCRVDEVPEPWQAEAWDPTAVQGPLLDEARDRLLTLVSPLSRIDRGLLRELARAIGLPGGVALELAAQLHPAVDGNFAETISIAVEQRTAWRQALSAVPIDDVRALIACLKRWHGWLGPEVVYEELVVLNDLGCGAAIDPADLQDAKSFFEQVGVDELDGRSGAPDGPSSVRSRWLKRVMERARDMKWDRSSALSSIGRIFYAIHRDNPDVEPPQGLEPWRPPGDGIEPAVPSEVDLFTRGDRLLFVPAGHSVETSTTPARPASHLGRLRFVEPSVVVEPPGGSKREIVRLDANSEFVLKPFASFEESSPQSLILRTDCSELHATVIRRERWQTAIGRDRHGLWCAFELAGVEFRMRWIPPGLFRMGSSREEIDAVLASLSAEDRKEYGAWYEREHPRHDVTITQGFWVGEVPVTQRQWEAVMGSNPSRFKSADRPVEQVSWDDVHEFLAKANGVDRELALRLPWECEWEHACRAGTTTATYAGEMEIRGKNDAPVLESIAWYGGNSAEEFELEEGYDNASFPQKSGKTGRAGTHPVGRRPANPWGLRDMLGNVWEWCEDGVREYTEAAEADPRGPLEAGVNRACRGGAWDSTAQRVRAGYRGVVDPSGRWYVGGFRLARGPQAKQEQDGRAEPAKSEPRSGEAGRRGTRRSGGGAGSGRAGRKRVRK